MFSIAVDYVERVFVMHTRRGVDRYKIDLIHLLKHSVIVVKRRHTVCLGVLIRTCFCNVADRRKTNAGGLLDGLCVMTRDAAASDQNNI